MRPTLRHVWRQIPSAALYAVAISTLTFAVAHAARAQPQAASKERPAAATAKFPPELVNWKSRPGNPIFTAEGPGHWDVKIRERGWILRDGNAYQLWFTGYDGTREGMKRSATPHRATAYIGRVHPRTQSTAIIGSKT